MFLFSSTYQDVASLACLPHCTSGQTFFYPAFNASRSEDAVKFAHEFGEVLGMPIMLEAVMCVHASKGLRMASFHGNFFVRSTDLLATPAVPTDPSYCIKIQIEDTLTAPFVVVQTAVLHTTCYGECQIRVVTLALPTTSSLSEVFTSADQVAIVTLLANKAIERSLMHFLLLALLTSLPSQTLVPYIYPTFYSLHNMPPKAGMVGENGVIMPTPLPLTSEHLERHGLFLIEDGQMVFLWISRDAVPQLVMDVFNLPNYELLRGGKPTLPVLDNPFSQRVNAIIQKTHEMRRGVYYPHLYVVKEDGEPPLRLSADSICHRHLCKSLKVAYPATILMDLY
ncbi:hypothetical protein PAXINDRAFT_18003 [Paxillus involutus ATCC 200175]|uniref:Protein transport protein SEC24 n=1 Tax=Paxillus involutus ATCC 200175 TaxID=664439 RepID=A0A0C9SZV3_PAXIN|nr:hypothetical protein PAXINDRAFT_18003 [Paxillus involutus ATCC 200175]